MATFTMTLRQVKEYDDRIGLEDYPIFAEAYREVLNRNIYEYYINREIGFETPEYFRMRVGNHMRVEMPYYNKLYESQLIEFNPLSTVDMTSESESNGAESSRVDAEGSSTATQDGSGKTVNHMFPQTELSDSEDYATSAVSSATGASNAGSSEETSTTEREARDTSRNRTTGYQGAPADIIARYRDTLINVDSLVIASLEPFFMSIWDTGDTYTDNYGMMLPGYNHFNGGFLL